MTNQNTNYLTKTLITTLTILMLTGLSAAAVQNAGTPSDVEIGQADTSQTISSLDFDSDSTATIDISSLTDKSGVSDGSISFSMSGTTTDDADISYSGGTITISSGATDVSTVNSVTISNIDTSGVSALDTGLTYTVNQGTDNPSTGFDLVDNTAPSAPAGVSATAVSGGDIEVTFDDVDESGTGVSTYAVKRSTTQGSRYSQVGSTITDQELASYTFTDTTASDGTTYYYVVAATDGAGNEGSQSSEVSAMSDSTPPTVESALITNSPISDSEAGNQQTVTIEFSETMDTTVEPTVEITGLSEGTLTVSESSYSGSTYEGTVTISDSNEDTTAAIEVSGADDQAGNAMSSTDSSNTFNVDTENPTVSTSFDNTQTLSETVDIKSYFTSSTGDGESTTYEYDDGSGFSAIGSPGSWDSTLASDGEVTFRATTTDDNGNENTASGSATVDNTDPSSLSVDNNPVLQSGQSVDVEVSFTETNPAKVDITIDGNTQTFNSVSNGENTLSVDAANLPGTEGTYDIQAVVTDTAGNTGSTTNTDALTIDDTDPTFSASKTDLSTIQATISDNQDVDESTISQSDFDLSTGTITSISKSESGTDATVTINLANNIDSETVDLSIASVQTISDAAGNQLTAAASSATINNMDGVAPSFSNQNLVDQSDDNSAVKDGDKVRVYATVTDGTDVNSVTADLSKFGAGNPTLYAEDSQNGQNWNGQNGDESNVYGAEVTVDESTATEGAGQDVTITATDSSNEENSDTSTFGSIETDFTAPSVTASGAAPSYFTASDAGVDVTSYFTITSSDGGSTTYEYQVNSSSWKSVSNTGSFDTTQFAEGSSLKFRATDTDDVGNSDSATTSSADLDRSEPVIDNVSISDSTNSDGVVGNGDTVQVAINLTEEVSGISSVTVDGTNFAAGTPTATSGTKHDYTASLTVGAASEGDQTVSVSATDNAGNGGSQAATSNSLKVDSTKPSISSIVTKDEGQPQGNNIGGTDTTSDFESTAHNGQIDQLVVTFSEPIQDSTVDTADLTVAGANELDTIYTGSNENDNKIIVDLQETPNPDTQATPGFAVAQPAIEDINGNTVAGGTTSSSDEADPVADFSEGTNMISFPSKVGVYNLDQIIDDSDNINSGNVESLWRYSNGQWDSYEPGRDSAENDFNKIEGGYGYILKASGPGKLVADVDQGQQNQNAPSGVSIHNNKWNLLGTYEEREESTGNAGLQSSDGIDQILVRDGVSFETLKGPLSPGEGYWVSANEESLYDPVFN